MKNILLATLITIFPGVMHASDSSTVANIQIGSLLINETTGGPSFFMTLPCRVTPSETGDLPAQVFIYNNDCRTVELPLEKHFAVLTRIDSTSHYSPDSNLRSRLKCREGVELTLELSWHPDVVVHKNLQLPPGKNGIFKTTNTLMLGRT